ncbi:MAG: aminotransferase class V-fold PLP-dependent enzyme [Candidatus Melainabacteria bacterium]|nr:MAG: aminotransferase class V-fold PLP-dependent enzyme [Candidatus Melainabacteria bacterium]
MSKSKSKTVDWTHIASKFPIFKERPGYLFFDNASTTQKPKTVIDCLGNFYRRDCANAGRASYQMSTNLASAIENARARVSSFIGAKSGEVAFTSGATQSLNMVALGWGLKNLKDGDEILLCPDDHKSTVLPWYNLQDLLASFGIRIYIKTIPLHHEGDYDLSAIDALLSDKTRLLAMTHVHHLYGLDMEVDLVRKIVGDKVLISLDASQSVGHRRVDLGTLPVDFLSFSGHKMFASNAVGVLWTKPSIEASMHPVIAGGGSLKETGTQNIPAILSMVPAIDFIESIGIDAISERLSDLTRHLYFSLRQSVSGLEFSPGVDRCGCHRGFGIVSFRHESVSSSDIAFLLDSENIMVRSGDHCLGRKLQGDDYLRVSLHVYNTKDEIDRLVCVLASNLASTN